VIVGEADGYVDLPVTLSAPATKDVSVDYATANSTAASDTACVYANDWYVGVPNSSSTAGTLTFTPGQTTETVRVDLNNCGNIGLDSFTFNLSVPVNSTNFTIVRPSTRVGIVGDPSPAATLPGLYARSAVVDNLAGSVEIPVMLGGPQGATSASTVTVDYATKNNTAVSGTDYTATSGKLTFGPGQSVENISVPILDRAGAAPTRDFTVTLSDPSEATIENGTATVTIGASGASAVASPNVSAPPDVIVGEADGYVDLPVTLSAPATKDVSVDYATANSTAASSTACVYANDGYVGVSGTLTFTPGQTTETVRVDILDCDEPNPGTFTFSLSGVTHAKIKRSTATVNIVEYIASISSFSPHSGPAGTAVTINGEGLSGATKVTFGTAVGAVTSDTATQIVVTVPATATTSKITVYTPQGDATSATSFKVT
jgi:chitinase